MAHVFCFLGEIRKYLDTPVCSHFVLMVAELGIVLDTFQW